MARARNIKPSFFQDDKLGELNPIDRLAFIGMWTVADFKGCIEYRPRMLKVQLLPYDDCDMEAITNNLEQARFIRFYSVHGKRYIKIVNFEKHQNPHKNEREAGSETPDISESNELTQENNSLQKDGIKPDLIGSARADSLLLIPSTLIPDSLNTDSGFPQGSARQADADITETQKPETDLQAACRETWRSYSNAYFERYGTEPVRNKTVNSQVKSFVQRIGFGESPQVAEFFVKSNTAFYVQRLHSFGNLLADAEKVRTEWATGMTAAVVRNAVAQSENEQVKEAARKRLFGESNATV